MECRKHQDPNCVPITTIVLEAQGDMNTATVKQETEYIHEEELPQSDYMCLSGPLKPAEYVNYYDSKGYMLKTPKQEFHEDKQPQSDCSMNNKIVSDNNVLSKHVVKQEIKHENTEELTLCLKEEYEDIDCQFETKRESLVKQETLSNIGDTKTYCDIQEVQCQKQNKTAYNDTMAEQPDEPIYLTALPLPPRSNASTSATPFAEPPTITARKSKAQKQREYRQRIAASRTPAQAIAARKSDAERQHNCRLRKAANPALVSGSLKQFRAVENLDRHILHFHKHKQSPMEVTGNGLKCKCCNADFKSIYRLNKHLKLFCSAKVDGGGERGIYTCNSCETVFKSKQNLIMHIKRMHYDYGRKFECWCGKQFSSPVNLRLHGKLHHRIQIKKDVNNGKFQCDSCQKFFKSKPSLVLHIRRVHYDYGKIFECLCGKQFRSPIYLKEHKKVHEPKTQNTDKGKFQCDSCKKLFKRKPNLVAHIKRFHYDYGRSFECFCGEKFCSPILLSQHKRRQHDPKIPNTDSFQCDSCQKVFKTKPCLIAHIKRMHYDYGRKFECWCGKQYRSPIQLSYHKKTQHVLVFGGYKFNL